MNLSAPKQATWLIAVVVALVGVLAYLVAIPGLSPFAFWIVVLAFVLLAAATLVEGL